MLGLLRSTAACILILTANTSVHAQTCTEDDFSKAVDGAGANLREFNSQNAPKLQAKLRQLKTAKGWSDAEFEERSADVLHDARVEDLDRQANEILARIDTLGVTTQGPLDCTRLADLQAASSELLATMKAKSTYMLSRLDTMIEGKPAQQQAQAAPPAKSASTPPPPAPQPKASPSPSPAPRAGWSTETRSEPTALEMQPLPDASPLPGMPQQGEDGYTIDEIREATRGFFGQLSTGLASVIEHAFRRGGRPTAYVLGQEGGGAFLAGVRYGDGTIYFRSGGSSKIWWHGPSIGYDVGAAGSRTMFLIYNLKSPEDIYRRFTGIDGSAYLVGGVGMTFLTNGEVVMAPIRTGLGLRLGASIGFIRFTPKQTWNPL